MKLFAVCIFLGKDCYGETETHCSVCISGERMCVQSFPITTFPISLSPTYRFSPQEVFPITALASVCVGACVRVCVGSPQGGYGENPAYR